MENIMNEVKELRKFAGVKQYVLAEQLGIEQSNYANVENGKMILNRLPQIKKGAIAILLPMLNE